MVTATTIKKGLPAEDIAKGFKKTEVGVIPMDWEVKKLGEVGEFKNGINKTNEYFGFGSPLVNLMDIFGRTKIETNLNFGLINSNEAEKKLYNLIKGDVLFIRSSVKPSGVGLTCVIINNLPDTVFSGFLIRFRDKGLLTDGYKQYYFYNEKFRNNLISNSTVSANTNINQEALKKLIIAFPKDKTEQTAIATILSDTDTLIERLEKLIAKKIDIKQGTMQLLLNGKKRLPEFSGEWEELELSEFGTLRGGSGFPLKYQGQSEGKYPFYKVSDMNTKGNEVFMSASNNYINENIRKLNAMITFPKDTIVFAKIGAAIFLERKKILSQDSCIDNNMMGFIMDHSKCNTYFFYSLFHCIKLGKLVSTTALPSLSGNEIGKLRLKFPSLTEQQAIAQILSDIDSEIEALKQKREKYKALKQGMMQQLLTGRIRIHATN